MSRVTKLEGLYLIGKFQPTIPPEPNNKVVAEMNRLRTESILLPKFTELRQVPDDCIQIISHNVRSLKPHINSIRHDNVFLASHFILLQETWLKVNDQEDFLSIPGKTIIARNKLPDSNSKGKGNIMYANENLDIISSGHYDRRGLMFEIDLTVCRFGNLFIVNMYKTKNSTTDHILRALDQLKNVNNINYLQQNNILICGDFNENLKQTSLLTNILNVSYGLRLLSPLESTTDHGTIIDGVFGRLTNYNYVITIYESYFSDHKPLIVRLSKKN